MTEQKRKANVKAIGVIALIVGVLAVAGCAPQASKPADAVPDAGPITMADIVESDPMNPVVKELADGTFIQRTPTENITPTKEGEAKTYRPEKNVPYNTYWLNADEKGCGSCHDDLSETVANMAAEHVAIPNPQGTETTVNQCLDCHVPQAGSQTNKNAFGSVIHSIHERNDRADCMNCHMATENNDATPQATMGTKSGMSLWDTVKHKEMRGIEKISSDALDDEFSYRIDETTNPDDLFYFAWNNNETNYDWENRVLNDEPIDKKVFEDWTITVTGEVNQEKTWTLPDLIAEAPSETRPMKIHCIINPTGGPLIGQANITGVPVKWMLEQAGIKDTAKSLQAVNGASGYGTGYTVPISQLDMNDAYIVYEIDGEPLSQKNGYPCWYVIGGVVAGIDTRWPNDIMVGSEEVEDILPFKDAEGRFYVKPNVGIFDLREGQIFKTGEKITFHGYADAFKDSITALEFSMDQGKTWKHFDTPNTNSDQWVTWTYDFTPPEDRAYTFMVRAIDDQGNVTNDPLEKMIVVKNEMPTGEKAVK